MGSRQGVNVTGHLSHTAALMYASLIHAAPKIVIPFFSTWFRKYALRLVCLRIKSTLQSNNFSKNNCAPQTSFIVAGISTKISASLYSRCSPRALWILPFLMSEKDAHFGHCFRGNFCSFYIFCLQRYENQSIIAILGTRNVY